MSIIAAVRRKFKLNLFRVGADDGKYAGPFDKLRAGSSTASSAQCANDSAQDDRIWGAEGRQTTTEADPYGMTNKRTGDGKNNLRFFG